MGMPLFLGLYDKVLCVSICHIRHICHTLQTSYASSFFVLSRQATTISTVCSALFAFLPLPFDINCVQLAYRRHQSKRQTSYILKYRKICMKANSLQKCCLKLKKEDFVEKLAGYYKVL